MLHSLQLQILTIGQLVSMELKRRFGGGLGDVVEELIDATFMMILMIGIRILAGGSTAHRGMEFAPFISSGLIIIIVFRVNFGSAMGSPDQFERMRNTLKFTPLDFDIMHLVVNMLFYSFIAFILFAVLIAVNVSPYPENPVGVLWAMFLGSLLGLFFGQTARAIITNRVARRMLRTGVQRASLWVSGAFFVAPELPYAWRDWIMYNPLVHLTELSRSHYFFVYHSDYYDGQYVFNCLAVLMICGLVLERAKRNREAAA